MSEAPSAADRPVYVADTHALYWYLQDPKKLSPAADAIFRLVEAGGAQIVVPAIVVAELYFLAQKQDHVLSIARLLDDIHDTAGYIFAPLGREQLAELDELPDVSEMHDRLIAAEARYRDAVVVTKDPILHDCPAITSVW